MTRPSEEPLSPGLKRYLAHFDTFLLADSAAHKDAARIAMRQELDSAAIPYRNQAAPAAPGARPRPNNCPDCGTAISIYGTRCRSCAQRRRRQLAA